jgi:hypothetical protein
VFPTPHASGDLIVDLVLVKKQREDISTGSMRRPFLPELLGALHYNIGYRHKMAGICKHAFRNERMDVRVEIYKRSKSLHGPDHGGNAAVSINFQCVNVPHGLPRCVAKLAQQRTVVAEIHPQTPWNSEHPLPVRHIGKHFIIEPVGKQQGAFLRTTGTCPSSPARKGKTNTLHV